MARAREALVCEVVSDSERQLLPLPSLPPLTLPPCSKGWRKTKNPGLGLLVRLSWIFGHSIYSAHL